MSLLKIPLPAPRNIAGYAREEFCRFIFCFYICTAIEFILTNRQIDYES